MGKKKFIDKKRSATFHLLSRDTSTVAVPDADDSDRVFVRVDNNPVSFPGLAANSDSDSDNDPDSIFADAPEDGGPTVTGSSSLPDPIRKQILELGLPDDGYNYLLHLRDIKNGGGGSAYYQNPKPCFDNVAVDVKAYDASRLRIEELGKGEEEGICKVAEKTVGVRVKKAADVDLMRLLDDGDLSRFESDIEDLEEDFVLMANQPGGEDEDEDEVEVLSVEDESVEGDEDCEGGDDEKPRVRRMLDEQFDLLTLREYDSNNDSDDGGYIDHEEEEPLAAKLQYALKDHKMDGLELKDEHSTLKDLEISADVILKCKEYGKTYEEDDQADNEVFMVHESSDESEAWDCETIVTSYSTLENHPGKITAPENPKRKLITLRGKEKLPVDFLPHSKKPVVESVKPKVNAGDDKTNWKPRSEETKEEKKERKAAVKGERREARQAKKELKVLYRCEAQRAQKGAAVAGPSSIHLM